MASAQQIHNGAVHDQASKETACGITEFVCPDLLGFTGILKKRYTLPSFFRYYLLMYTDIPTFWSTRSFPLVR